MEAETENKDCRKLQQIEWNKNQSLTKSRVLCLSLQVFWLKVNKSALEQVKMQQFAHTSANYLREICLRAKRGNRNLQKRKIGSKFLDR